MKAQLVQIGNSKGVRIPKPILEQVGLVDAVELSVDAGRLIIAPARKPRNGWEQAFGAMASAGDDALLIPDTLESKWDDEEWRW